MILANHPTGRIITSYKVECDPNYRQLASIKHKYGITVSSPSEVGFTTPMPATSVDREEDICTCAPIV